MSEAEKEIDEKLEATREQLDATLKKRETAEQAVSEAESELQKRREVLQSILLEEGKLRGIVGDLERMRGSLDAAPDGSDA